MKEIKLTKGYVCKVDDADYEELSKYKWHVNVGSRGTIYARRTETYEKGKRRHVFMHCYIKGVEKGSGYEVDHRDRDGLNNQRDNLRVCTHSKNAINRKKWGQESKYRGVSKRGKKWCAVVLGKYLGTFDDEIKAAQAYDKEAMTVAGEYAFLNFPEQQTNQGEVIQ